MHKQPPVSPNSPMAYGDTEAGPVAAHRNRSCFRLPVRLCWKSAGDRDYPLISPELNTVACDNTTNHAARHPGSPVPGEGPGPSDRPLNHRPCETRVIKPGPVSGAV
ncbi:hypothetical protein NHX12_010472 [Muraenolepis orangiensis]|uniref:Uncharacterized protein n=1 Tax=Muraenolepis orangiensis TaxID=630683 RepID=A0A9Q0DJN4_9TELE|nr:hypothetical protein NHX12_010472 [Muraenolepis orangiensis]